MTTATVSSVLAASPLIWALERVRLPGPSGPVPFRPYPYQATLLADRSPTLLVLKARQTGITTVGVIRELHEMVHRPRSLVLAVSKGQGDADELVRLAAEVLAELGDAAPRRVNDSVREIELENGSRMVSVPATAKAGRGFTATSVLLDEFAFAAYDGRIYRAVLPTLSRGGRLTVVSTPDGQANLFYKFWQGQEGGDWSRHRVHWRDCPVFDNAWYERERPKYTAADWASEYECDFIESGGAVFDPADVDAMVDGWVGLQPPQSGRRYVTAADIGRRHDATVILTVDVTERPYQIVNYKRLVRAPYHQSAAAIDAVAAEYGGEVHVESNNTGDSVLELLTCSAKPFKTTAQSKPVMLQRLVGLVERRQIRCGVQQVLSELRTYQWADSNIVQDSVMALAIAVQAVESDGWGGSFMVYTTEDGDVIEIGGKREPAGGKQPVAVPASLSDQRQAEEEAAATARRQADAAAALERLHSEIVF